MTTTHDRPDPEVVELGHGLVAVLIPRGPDSPPPPPRPRGPGFVAEDSPDGRRRRAAARSRSTPSTSRDPA